VLECHQGWAFVRIKDGTCGFRLCKARQDPAPVPHLPHNTQTHHLIDI